MLQPQRSSKLQKLVTKRISTLQQSETPDLFLAYKTAFLASTLACINISTEESQTRESEFLWVSTRPLKCPSKRYIRNI